MIFEMLAGNPPFTASQPMQIFKKVMFGIDRVTFPSKCQGPARDLVKALLTKDPSRRLPMKIGGVKGLKQHPSYTSFSWEDMESEKMTPPYVPKVHQARPRQLLGAEG